MTAKLRNINQWRRFPDGALPLPGARRVVTIDFNVDRHAKLTLMQDKRETLLRAVEPQECPLTVQFAVEGDCAIVAEAEGEVWWSSDDGDILSYEVHEQSFTELEQRMEMTPEMEATLLRAALKREQRHREVAELLLLKKQREEAEAANADPETGEVEDDGEPLGADSAPTEGGEGAGGSTPPKS
ncbi:hypothetical protein [Tortoise microvirus 73]|nr:hypothetical protein [Tortoise microvirus 73]